MSKEKFLFTFLIIVWLLSLYLLGVDEFSPKGFFNYFENDLEHLKEFAIELSLLINLLILIYILDRLEFHKNNIYQEYSFNKITEPQLPYKLDPDLFVKIIPFAVKKDLISRENIIKEINSYLSKKSPKILIKAEFGMGKTSICQILNISNNSFYLNNELLENAQINFETELKKDIVDLLIENYIKSKEVNSILAFFLSSFFYFQKNKILLIFDALDEMNLLKSEFKNFEKMLIKADNSVICTVREEYIKNFTKKLPVELISLKHWTHNECLQYTKLLDKKIEKEDERSRLKFFENKIKQSFNENFYSRPLFLNMLIYLEVTNNTDMTSRLGIENNLSDNLSELYFKYILLHIEYEIERINYDENIAGLDSEDLSLIIIKDLKEFAVNKYLKKDNESYSEHFEKILGGEKHTLGILKYNKNRKNSEKKYIKHDFVHKSFYEYLLGYALADSVLKYFPDLNKVNKSKCNDVWKIFQNYEISSHFTEDVQRRVQTKLNENIGNIDFKNISNEFFKVAFMKVLENGDFSSYTHKDPSEEERIEQALSYIGRFKLFLSDEESKKIKSKIFNIDGIKNTNCDFVYFRTASLTFTNIENVKYIVNYINFIVENENFLKKDQLIQKNYYGDKSVLMRRKLKNGYLKPFLDNKEVKSNFCHALFTFFTIDSFEIEDIDVLRDMGVKTPNDLLFEVKSIAESNNDEHVIYTCNIINTFLIDKI